MSHFAPLYALVIPFLLWPIGQVSAYLYVTEEIAKLILVASILKTNSIKSRFFITISTAGAFTLSQTLISIINTQAATDINTVIYNFLFAAPMHTITLMIMLITGMVSKKLLPASLIITIYIHAYFNQLINLYPPDLFGF